MTPAGVSRLRTVSLRRRVTVATVAVFAVVVVAVTVAVDASFSIIVNRSIAAVLTDHMQLADQLAAQDTPPAELVDRLETRSVRARLVLADGQVLGSLKPYPSPSDETVKTRRVRLTNTTGPLAGAQLTLAVDGRLLAGARTRLTWALLLVAVVAVGVIALAVPITAKMALAPLDAMTRLARSIVAGRRGERLWPRTADTELGRMASAFDEMLDALEGAEHRALASEESMRRFVADAAHELRTPIAGIAAAAEAVLQLPDDPDPARQRLLMVLGGDAQRAGRLIDDLLDLARLDTGLSLHPEPTDLRELAEGQVERARLLHPDVPLRVDGPAVTAPVDAARIGQVLANVLNNACEVTPAGGLVCVAISRLGTDAEVAISDSGPGVAAEQRERIFERLVRLDTARGGSGGGAGLGLTIARGIARAHGGDLVCDAPPPGSAGAVFVLRLPGAR